MTSRVRVPSFGALAGAAACVCVLALTAAALPTAGAQSDDRRAVEREIDVLTASREEISRALAGLDARYVRQRAAVDEARAAVDAAVEAERRALARVRLAQNEVEIAREQVRAYAVEAYLRPPAKDALRVLSFGNVEDATYTNSVLKILSTERQKVVEVLVEKRAIAAAEQRRADAAAERARELANEAETQLLELDRTRAEQQAVAASLDERLDAALAESAALAEIDRQMAEELAAQELALRQQGPASVVQVAAVTEAATPDTTTTAPSTSESTSTAPPPGASPVPTTRPPTPTTRPPAAPTTTRPPAPPTTRPPATPAPPPPSGTVTWADVTNVGGIWVHRSIATNVRNLLNAATAAGFSLRGGGYRDSAAQVATRRANCGPTYYDIYQKPASQCTPPTAIPGRSMHEQGLAIDFTSNGSLITSRSNPAFIWLSNNAARFGLYNLPSEPWHWSTNGR